MMPRTGSVLLSVLSVRSFRTKWVYDITLGVLLLTSLLTLIFAFRKGIYAAFPSSPASPPSLATVKEGFGMSTSGNQLLCKAVNSKAIDYGEECGLLRKDNKLCVGDTCIDTEEFEHILTAEEEVRKEMERVRATIAEQNEASQRRIRKAVDDALSEIREGAFAALDARADSVSDLHDLARKRDHIIPDDTFVPAERVSSSRDSTGSS